MKKLMKIMALAMSCAMVFGAVACGGNPPPPPSDVTYSVQFDQLDANLTGEVRILKPTNDLEDDIMNAAIAGFKTKYPKVTFKQETVDIGKYNEQITKLNSIDNLPDILWTDSSKTYSLKAMDIALNLDYLMDDATEAGVIDAENDFTPEFNAMGTYKGVRYAIPRTADSIVTFYNKTEMDAAGVDMTQYNDGWTWTQFLSVCETLRNHYDSQSKPTYYPIQPNLNWDANAWAIVKSLGGEIISEDGEWSGALTQAKASEIYDFVHNLVTSDYIPDIAAGETFTNSFESGNCPMLFQSTTIANYEGILAVKEAGFDIVPFPLINGENSAIGSGYAGYALNKDIVKDQNKLNIAGAFLAYMMSYDGQQKLAKDGKMTNPSIRLDLGVDNADAEWHKKYAANYNVGAYTWGGQYKVEVEFANYVDAKYVPGVMGAMVSFVGGDCVEKAKLEAYNSYNTKMARVFI